MKCLVIKESNSALRRRKTLRWAEDEYLTWSRLLTEVEKEFAVSRQNIQLSLNHGKTFIEATGDTDLSMLGIVSGDILTLVQKVDTQHTIVSTQTPATTVSATRPDMEEMKNELDHMQTSAEGDDDEQIAMSDPDGVNRFLKLPMLLRDVADENLPPSFQELLAEQSNSNPVDQLVLAIHTLLLESGFVFSPLRDELLLSQIRSSPSLYKMAYRHVFDEDSKVTIACVLMGSQLAVHAVVQPTGNLSVTFRTKRFISEDGLLKTKMLQLSNQFKDLLVTPLILAMKEAMCLPALPAVLDIPYELTVYLLNKLDYRSISMLGCTCKQLSRVYRDNSVWRRLYVQKFGAVDLAGTKQDNFWYNRFKERSMRYKANRMPQFYPSPPIPTYPSFPSHSPFTPPSPFLPPPILDDPANQGLPHLSPAIGLDNNILGFRPPTRNTFGLRHF